MIKHTKEILEKAVAESDTWAEVCRKVGVKPFTGSQTHLKKRCIEFGLDHSHFVGQGWSKGKTSHQKKNISEYLVSEC
jgi:hypothetical protein